MRFTLAIQAAIYSYHTVVGVIDAIIKKCHLGNQNTKHN